MRAVASVLRLAPPVEPIAEPPVVAEILADGTIRTLTPGLRARITEAKQGWTTGTVSSGRWIMWWQRRST